MMGVVGAYIPGGVKISGALQKRLSHLPRHSVMLCACATAYLSSLRGGGEFEIPAGGWFTPTLVHVAPVVSPSSGHTVAVLPQRYPSVTTNNS